MGGGYKNILCPFDKEESNFNRVLTENGFNVTYSHIETGTDFFEINNLSDYDAIVSNPPFSKRQQVLEKLFESKVPFAMITNFNGLFDAKSRWELFRKNKFELIIPLGRMHFFNDDCKSNSPNFQSIWVCSGMCDKQIVFHDDNMLGVCKNAPVGYDIQNCKYQKNGCILQCKSKNFK